MKIQQTSPRSQKGFSLIEVLVAAGIGTGIILMMMMAMRVGTEGFSDSTQRIDALVEARAALGVLSDDVATMVGVGDENFGWTASDERFHEIWFLTLKPLEAQDSSKAVGDVCYVHYFTAVTQDAPVVDSAYSRKLYRRFVSSGDLLERLNNGTLPTPVADPDRAEAVAFNVTRFVAQPLARTNAAGPLANWAEGNGLPVALDIDFQVVDSDTAGLMRLEEDWNLTTKIAQTMVLEDGDEYDSRAGREFQLNLKVGHAN